MISTALITHYSNSAVEAIATMAKSAIPLFHASPQEKDAEKNIISIACSISQASNYCLFF